METALPPLVLLLLLAALASVAALANCALLATLFTAPRNGLHTILIQLAVADFALLLLVIAPELWYHNDGTWTFGRSSCIAYKGIDVFATTASLYLVVTIALHTLATVNIEKKSVLKRIRRERDITDDEGDGLKSSRHSLVANSNSSTPPRTMKVDYSLSDTRVRVGPPTLFVWILAASLSVPEFIMSTTIRAQDGIISCTLVDMSHQFNMQFMLAAFNVVIPLFIFSVIFVFAVRKLKCKIVKGLLGDYGQSEDALKLTLCLIVLYVMFCAPRSILTSYRVFFADNEGEQSWDLKVIFMVFSGMCLLSTLLRPLLCFTMLPMLRRCFKFGSQALDEDTV